MTIAGVVTEVTRPARGRQLRLRRVPDQRRRAAGPGAGDRRDHHHPGRAGVLRAAPTGRDRPAARPATTATRALYFDQMDRKLPIGHRPRRRPHLPQPRLPRRHPRRARLDQRHLRRRHQDQLRDCSCCTRSSPPACSAAGAVNAKALVFSVKGEDLLFLDYANIRLDDDTPADVRRPRPARRALRVGRLLLPTTPRRPHRPPARHRPDQRGRHRSGGRCAEFCTGELLPYVFADAEDERNQYTMVVHQVAARLRAGRAAPARTAPSASTATPAAPTTTWSTSSSTGSPTTPPARSGPAPVTGLGTINAFIRRLRSSLQPLRALIRADLPDTGARADLHRRTTRSPSSTCTTCRERAQRFVVGVVLRRGNRPQGGGRAGQPAVHHDRRAQQVRTAGGQQPDQGRPAGHRRARPSAWASS